jgi:acyl-CoA oxidase
MHQYESNLDHPRVVKFVSFISIYIFVFNLLAILDYRAYQLRLIPIIVSCYATNSVKKYLFKKYAKLCASETRDEEEVAEVHALASGLKAITSWETQGYLNTLRELCGGHGYSAYNLMGELRNDHDILQTFEGLFFINFLLICNRDNTVLLQQTTYYLIKQFKDKFNGNQFTDMLAYFREKAKTRIINP